MNDFRQLVENVLKDVENLPSVQALISALEDEEAAADGPENPFVAAVLQNAARVTKYQLGRDGSKGGCDCIGLVIGALRLMGKTWPGIHGTNYTVRYNLVNFAPITGADALHVGELVFKVRAPGSAGYSLPDRYSKHQDKNDYYHVGVVTSVSPLEIIHCTNTPGGIKRDTTLGKWKYKGDINNERIR